MSYVLTGPLAQIGRSSMVRDLVRRIGEAFAQNLDAQLRDPAADLRAAPLGGLSLITRILADRMHGLLARLLGR
jgi:aerobic carbon-monoxide dehydrogenase small subunit